MRKTLMTKDFTFVVIGQIISLFGNATIRFALPLYLLNQTGSSAIFGSVTAVAFLPSILFSPIGGIMADRINKRNIMVVLDFMTAALIFLFMLFYKNMSLVLVIALTMMVLYGIAGAYQPSVQASVPVLVAQKQILKANAIINAIGSLANLLGPVIGGILYSAYGLETVLWVCMFCFLFSAIMEIFIHIPYEKQNASESISKMVFNDMKISFRYIWKENPIIGKLLNSACFINLFLSSMITVALPYLITEVLSFEPNEANELYGYAQGILGIGGLMGGVLAGILASRLNIKKSGVLLVYGLLALLPMGIALLCSLEDIQIYFVIVFSCFVSMMLFSLFSIQMLAFMQEKTPQTLIGKVMSVVLMVSMCAQPLGNAFYGFCFAYTVGYEYLVIFFASFVSLFLVFYIKNAAKQLDSNHSS